MFRVRAKQPKRCRRIHLAVLPNVPLRYSSLTGGRERRVGDFVSMVRPQREHRLGWYPRLGARGTWLNTGSHTRGALTASAPMTSHQTHWASAGMAQKPHFLGNYKPMETVSWFGGNIKRIWGFVRKIKGVVVSPVEAGVSGTSNCSFGLTRRSGRPNLWWRRRVDLFTRASPTPLIGGTRLCSPNHQTPGAQASTALGHTMACGPIFASRLLRTPLRAEGGLRIRTIRWPLTLVAADDDLGIARHARQMGNL